MSKFISSSDTTEVLVVLPIVFIVVFAPIMHLAGEILLKAHISELNGATSTMKIAYIEKLHFHANTDKSLVEINHNYQFDAKNNELSFYRHDKKVAVAKIKQIGDKSHPRIIFSIYQETN